ncbi:unnamed protein product [Protopolystoma xenopodis]|uniref:Uncharacterized protein n=1 Tax=Protopolystoma xenopodis TaxID=117903 RepID=A0A3S5BHJ9_9PLAT|nr:unnamed protein product [Protopolystoma xenopodis]
MLSIQVCETHPVSLSPPIQRVACSDGRLILPEIPINWSLFVGRHNTSRQSALGEHAYRGVQHSVPL